MIEKHKSLNLLLDIECKHQKLQTLVSQLESDEKCLIWMISETN